MNCSTKDREMLEKVVKDCEEIGDTTSRYLMYRIKDRTKGIESRSMRISSMFVITQYSLIRMTKVFLNAVNKVSPKSKDKIKDEMLKFIKEM